MSTPAPVAAETGTTSSKAPSSAARASCGTSACPRTASILFTTQIAGAPADATFCSYTYASPRPTPDAPSTTCTTTSTPSTASPTRSFNRAPSNVRGLWKPGVSVYTICASSSVAIARISRRVVCGLSDTIATFWPTSTFTSVDLPTFGRPTTATIPLRKGRRSSGASAIVGDVVVDDLDRNPADHDGGDPATLHLGGSELEALKILLVAGRRDLAEDVEYETADRVPFLVGELHVEHLVHVVDRGLPRDAVDTIAELDHLGLLDVVLIGDLADQLLEQVLERHDPGDRPVLVGHERLVVLLLLHLSQQVGGLLRFRHEVGGAHDVGQRHVHPPLMERLQHVLGEHHADDVVEILVEDRDPGVAVLEHQRLHVAQRARILARDDIGTGHHHLARDGVAELEDRVDQLLLFLLDLALARRDLSGGLELLLGDERTLLQTLAGHEDVRELEECLGEGAEQAAEERDRRRDEQRDPVGALDREGLRRDVGEHVQHQRQHDRRDDLARVAEVPDGERRCDRRAADREQQRQEQHDVQVRGWVLDDPSELVRASPPLLPQTNCPHSIHPGDRDLGRSEEPDHDDRDEDDEEREVVGSGHGARTPL